MVGVFFLDYTNRGRLTQLSLPAACTGRARALQASHDHHVIGLKILNQLVEEINIPTSGRTLPQHRKTAVSFRDLCLLPIFQVGARVWYGVLGYWCWICISVLVRPLSPEMDCCVFLCGETHVGQFSPTFHVQIESCIHQRSCTWK